MGDITRQTGQIQRPGEKPENVQLFTDSTPIATSLEQSNNVKPLNNHTPGDALRYGAKVNGDQEDTQAFNDAIQSGHPAFCSVTGNAKIDGTIVLDGNKNLTLPAGLTLQRYSASTIPLLHSYGVSNVFNGNMAV